MRMVGLLAALALAPQSKPVKELYDSGKVKAQYQLDAAGRRDGQYQEFHENGKRRLVATYAHGVLERAYEEFHENGKPRLKKRYAKGRIDGDLLRFDDKGVLVHRMLFRKGQAFLYPDLAAPVPVHDRSIDALRKQLDEIDPPALLRKWAPAERFDQAPSLSAPHKAGTLKKEYVESALRHVKAYRYLSGVHTNLAVDEAYMSNCQHGAVVLALNKGLSHEPPQPPGLPKDFFDRGYQGCNKSNISAYPGGSLRDSIDGFMNDSDPSNIERVGHRAWILLPELGKVGFGEAGTDNTFKTLWVVDYSARAARPAAKPARPGPKAPEFDAYPAPGYYPVEYLAKGAAWSAHPRNGSFRVANKADLRIEVWALTDEYDLDRKLEINHTSIGLGGGIVFRPVFPAGRELAGSRFLVSIMGKGPERIAYIVEFCRRAAPADSN